METKWLDPVVVMGKLEELRGFDSADLAAPLAELKVLATEATRTGERLYCWVCV